MILALRTDSSESQLLLLDHTGAILEQELWESGRELASRLLEHLLKLVKKRGDWTDLEGLIVYRGPGSFTSLRIGLTTMNTIANALSIPIVGSEGEDWHSDGIDRLTRGKNDSQVMPIYGADPHITPQKK